MKTIFNLIILLICTFLCVTLSGCSITPGTQIKYGNGEYYDSTEIYAYDGIKASVETKNGGIYDKQSDGIEGAPSEPGVNQDTITVCILGAVVNPGVYILPEGSRIYELINEAGGTTGEADTGGLNYVAQLKDGNQITIPTVSDNSAQTHGDPAEISGANETNIMTEDESDKKELVNINTASLSVLMTLPGIGETRAKAIIDYRETNGSFERIEDVMKVNGIKSGTYNGFSDLICVN